MGGGQSSTRATVMRAIPAQLRGIEVPAVGPPYRRRRFAIRMTAGRPRYHAAMSSDPVRPDATEVGPALADSRAVWRGTRNDVILATGRENIAFAASCGLVAAGLIVGGVGAWYLSATAKTFLFGLQANDPRAFAAALVSLALAALVASIVPARRAASVDPTVALRAE